MPSSYLDTTILVDVGQGREPQCATALRYTRANQPVLVPEYAYRELLVGRVGLLCDAHNKMKAADNPIDVALVMLARGGFGRTPIAQAVEILRPLREMFDKEAAVDPVAAKRKIVEELMMMANKLWRRARDFPLADHVQPLPCFNNGSIQTDRHGLLRGPGDTFNCVDRVACGAAQRIYENRVSLRKMITALDSDDLPEKLKNKGETRSRRRMLKDLESKGPAYVTRARCRKIGDAYFAAMCPAGSHVVTTNVDDYLPLCGALKKEAKVPV